MKHRTTCRICDSSNLVKFFELGTMPLANNFISAAGMAHDDPKFPLDLYLCKNCFLVQLSDIVDKEVMFRHYLYSSSQSNTMRIHFSKLAAEVASTYASKDDLVLEIASNDGILLTEIQKYGLKCLGIEPAKNLAEIARRKGIETIDEFFDEDLARRIIADRSGCKVVLANNVVGHIDDLQGFVLGVKGLLSDDGVFIFEVPYIVDFVKNNEFDTVYHEHLSYFGLRPLKTLFDRYGMEIFDAKRFDIHGGSIRVYVRKSRGADNDLVSTVVQTLLDIEKQMRLDDIITYLDFVKGSFLIKSKLQSILSDLKKKGKLIVGYGAPAKGTVLLNFCQIDTKYLDYVIDTTPMKQGLHVPGVRIPIFSPDELNKRTPDYILVLAWNYAKEILEKETQLREKGVKFILPLPSITIV